METFDSRLLTYPILKWVIGRRSSEFIVGALTNRFKQKIKMQDNRSTFFWENCLECPLRWSFECPGVSVQWDVSDCKVHPNSDWEKYKVTKMVEIEHPPLLTFLKIGGVRRYTYNILPEQFQSSSPDFLDMEVMPYSRVNGDSVYNNYRTPGYICLGGVERLPGELFFFEYDHGFANADLCPRNGAWREDHDWDNDDFKISLEEWILNFEDYIPEFIENSEGEGFPVSRILSDSSSNDEWYGPDTYGEFDWFLVDPEEYPILEFEAGSSQSLALKNDSGNLFDWGTGCIIKRY
jgi:hypothetical protein